MHHWYKEPWEDKKSPIEKEAVSKSQHGESSPLKVIDYT